MKKTGLLIFVLAGIIAAVFPIAGLHATSPSYNLPGDTPNCPKEPICGCCEEPTIIDDCPSCKKEESCSKCAGKNAAGSGSAAVRSVDVNINVGGPRNDSVVDGGLILYCDRPFSGIFTPQFLRFTSPLTTRIVNVSNRILKLAGRNGRPITYTFASNSSSGFASGKSFPLNSYFEMLDSSGASVTSNPYFYEYRKNAQKIRYLASTGDAISYTTESGRTISLSDSSVGIEIINEEGGVIRQVKTVQGFADIVTISENKYEIRVYAPGDEGSKNTQGLYEPTGTAHTVWTIENPLADTTKVDRLKVTQTFGGNSYVFDYKYTEGTNAWKLTSGGGLSVELKNSMSDPDGEYRLDTVTVTNGTAPSFKSVAKLQLGNFTPRVVEKTIDPDGAALKTEYTYYTNSSETGKFGRLRTMKNPDGSSESYSYDTYGRKTIVVKAYKDSAFDSSAANADATYYSYTAVDQDDTPITRDPRPRTVERKILGTSVSKTYYAYKTISGETVEITERCTDISKNYGDASNLRTTRTYYAPGSASSATAGMLKSIVYPDGRKDSYTYEYGTYTSDPNPASSSFTAGSGDSLRTTVVHGTTASSDGVANKTTKESRRREDRKRAREAKCQSIRNNIGTGFR